VWQVRRILRQRIRWTGLQIQAVGFAIEHGSGGYTGRENQLYQWKS
jgi:hypothetical protein